jgi:hypothetical protein
LRGWIAHVITAVREAGQKPITDETGVGVAALAGWTLSLVGDDYAVLANEPDHATIILRTNR